MGVLKVEQNNKVHESATIIVRIQDNQRDMMPRKAYYGDLSNAFLPERLQKIAFNGDARGDSIRGIIPQGLQNKEAYRNAIQSAFNQVSFS